MNYFEPYYYWKIDGGDDLSKPFLFRIVKANGTQEDQALRGFQSELFWIASNKKASSPTSSLSTMHLTSATSPVPSASKLGEVAGKGKDKGSGGGGGGGLSTGAEAGIGAGVGIGVGLALLAGIGCFFYRRKQKKKKDAQPQQGYAYAPAPGGNQSQYDGPPPMAMGVGGSQRSYNDQSSRGYQSWPSPSGQSAQVQSVAAYELQPHEVRSPVEAPGAYAAEPQELQADRLSQGEFYNKSRSPPPQSMGIQPWDGRDAGA